MRNYIKQFIHQSKWQCVLKKEVVYNNILDERKKIKIKFEKDCLFRIAEKWNISSERYTTNWSYELHSITQIIDDTVPSYWKIYVPEIYNETLLRKQVAQRKKMRMFWKI